MATTGGGVPKILSDAEIAAYAMGAGMGTGSGDKMSREDATVAVAIALAESGGNTNAHNVIPPDNSYGLWQINMYGNLGPARLKEYNIPNNEVLFVPAANAAAMRKIKAGQGWSAWSVYKSGVYRRYLDRAQVATQNPARVPVDFPGSPTMPDGSGDFDPLGPLKALLGSLGLRVAGFVGGGVLLILGIVLFARSQGTSVLKGVLKK